MSSGLQSVLAILQQNDYLSLVVLVAVGYDYVLTFSNEIEYIWCKPWTWVSTLFILVRYCGLYSLVIPILREILYVVEAWTFILFLGAADFVMILRIWTMFHRSRVVFGILLILFLLEIISTILTVAINSDPKNLSVVTGQLFNFSFCLVDPTPRIWAKVAIVLQITHATAMCTFASVRFVKESLQMYRTTKQWQLNRYMNLLVKEGILYFFAIFLFSLLNGLATADKLPTAGWQLIVLPIVTFIPIYTLTPRFIMSMRELYARSVHNIDGRGSGIDTAFGLSSGGRAADEEIVFVDVGQSKDLEDGEIPREVMEIRRSQSN